MHGKMRSKRGRTNTTILKDRKNELSIFRTTRMNCTLWSVKTSAVKGHNHAQLLSHNIVDLRRVLLTRDLRDGSSFVSVPTFFRSNFYDRIRGLKRTPYPLWSRLFCLHDSHIGYSTGGKGQT